MSSAIEALNTLRTSFDWKKSRQGTDYWEGVFDNIQREIVLKDIVTLDTDLCREAYGGNPNFLIEIARQVPALNREARIEVRQTAERYEVWQGKTLFAASRSL